MNTMMVRKEKSRDKIVYYYSSDVANFGGRENTPVDGEIEYIFSTGTFQVLKPATGDDDGSHARFMMGPMRSVIIREGSPERRFVAIG